MALIFSHKIYCFSFDVIGIYLLPGNSLYGHNAKQYFDYLSSMLVRLDEKDFVSIIGDYNYKIGNTNEIIETLDKVILQNRYIVDNVINEHEKTVIEF